MSAIQQFRERQRNLAIEARRLLDSTSGTTWNNDHQKKYDEFTTEITALDDRIDREQKILDLMAENEFSTESSGRFNQESNVKYAKTHKREFSSDAERVFDLVTRFGERALNADDIKIYNTLSTTTSSEGGYTVPTALTLGFIDKMKDYSGMRQVSEIIQTESGADVPIPITDGTSEVGELVAQNTTVAAADPTFSSLTLSCYKWSSKEIAVPIELLQDSAIDIEKLLIKRIQERIARSQNTYFTTGTGSSQPYGVAAQAGSGKVGTTGQTLTIIYNDIVDLIDSIDAAYLRNGNAKFMFSQTMRKVIRKLTDSNGRPIWQPGYDANGISQSLPDMLMGYPVQINNDVAVPAANAKSMLFGDFSNYLIRDVMDIQIHRFTDSPYTKKGQVGFLAYARAGGLLRDNTSVKYYANSAT